MNKLTLEFGNNYITMSVFLKGNGASFLKIGESKNKVPFCLVLEK